eukprot:TRINITY_DN5959_c0_g1_i1.p1 TRINITY_DN5959_c0_g1~~TRINITY_DN5959_c0_g1_i1.p1  ORF type:complete len:325 (+),score=88.90 TRINITY_DN5959_c0_g1_i1:25-999(+)
MDPLDPTSFNHKFAQVNGVKIHYIDEGKGNETLVFVHGFPDSWFGWRKQISHFSKLGFRVIVPDVRGYGHSENPKCPPNDLKVYSWKTRATDISQLLDSIGVKRAFFVGHDWGSHLVFRIALYFPEKVKAIAALCVPFNPPNDTFVDIDTVIQIFPNFKYQKVLAEDREFEELVNRDPRSFLASIMRSHEDLSGLEFINSENPSQFIGSERSKLLSEAELEYYTEQYKNSSFHGPICSYRLREISYEEEKGLPKRIDIPVLMITVGHDPALPPTMAKSMPKYCTDLTMKHIEKSAHWVQFEQPQLVNQYIGEFLQKLVASLSKL